jgi:hypothetical protein
MLALRLAAQRRVQFAGAVFQGANQARIERLGFCR